jgi:hypothetical protein
VFPDEGAAAVGCLCSTLDLFPPSQGFCDALCPWLRRVSAASEKAGQGGKTDAVRPADDCNRATDSDLIGLPFSCFMT